MRWKNAARRMDNEVFNTRRTDGTHKKTFIGRGVRIKLVAQNNAKNVRGRRKEAFAEKNASTGVGSDMRQHCTFRSEE